MKRYFIISLLTLASTVAPLTAVFAQSSFIYEKGKSFKDVNASPMPQTIRLDRTAEPVIYENAVPENATTICYRIQLPSYVRGDILQSGFPPRRLRMAQQYQSSLTLDVQSSDKPYPGRLSGYSFQRTSFYTGRRFIVATDRWKLSIHQSNSG